MGNDAPKRMDTPNSISRAEVRHGPHPFEVHVFCGARLREAREAAGLSFRDLAEALDVPSARGDHEAMAALLERTEARDDHPPTHWLRGFCRVLHVELEDLFEPVAVVADGRNLGGDPADGDLTPAERARISRLPLETVHAIESGAVGKVTVAELVRYTATRSDRLRDEFGEVALVLQIDHADEGPQGEAADPPRLDAPAVRGASDPASPVHEIPTFRGESVREARLAVPLTRVDLAAALQERGHDLDAATVAAMEWGRFEPTPAMLADLVEILGVVETDLLMPGRFVSTSRLAALRTDGGPDAPRLARLLRRGESHVAHLEADPLGLPLRDLVAWASACGYGMDAGLRDAGLHVVGFETTPRSNFVTDWIRREREAQGLTVEQLAERAAVSPRIVRHCETHANVNVNFALHAPVPPGYSGSLYEQLAHALFNSGRSTDVLPLLEEQRRISERVGDVRTAAQASLEMALHLHRRGDLDAAIEIVERYAVEPERYRDDFFTCYAHRMRALVLTRAGRLVDALSWMEASGTAAARIDHDVGVLQANTYAGQLHALMGDMAGATAAFDAADELAGRMPQERARYVASAARGRVGTDGLGDPVRLAAALEIARRGEYVRGAAQSLYWLGRARVHRGDLGGGDDLEAAFAATKRVGHVDVTPPCAGLLAVLGRLPIEVAEMECASQDLALPAIERIQTSYDLWFASDAAAHLFDARARLERVLDELPPDVRRRATAAVPLYRAVLDGSPLPGYPHRQL